MQKIGVIRGGVGTEYELSLKTGANVARALSDAGYEAIDMLLDKEGVLHIKGIPAEPHMLQYSVDKVWNALHGTFGEDGQLQSMLESYGVPYTGGGVLASALTYNKARAKERANALGIKTPESMLVIPDGNESVSEVTGRIYQRMAPPWVLKPLSGGGSVHTHFAFTPLDLSQVVEESISHREPFLVEQYIEGREAAVGVIGRFRNTDEYVLPVVEIASDARNVLQADTRKDMQNEYAIAGGTFSTPEREELSKLARTLHREFEAGDYSQSEFVIDRFGRIWFIEMDTSPHFTNNAPFLIALDAVGSSLKEFVAAVLENKRK